MCLDISLGMCPTVFHPLKFSSLQQMAHANGVNFLKTLTRFKLNFKLFSISSLAPGGLATRSYIVRQRVYTYCCHFFFFFWKGCSYENSFPVVFPFNRGKHIIFLRSYMKYFSRWAIFLLTSCEAGKTCKKTIFKMDDTNLKKY